MNDNPIRLEKLRKRESLLKQKTNPYPPDWRKKSWGRVKLSDSAVLNQKAGSSGELSSVCFYFAGRLMRRRSMGKAAFFNLQDERGQIQCYIRKDAFYGEAYDLKTKKPPAKDSSGALNGWELWKLCDIGDIVSVKGVLFKTKKGEPSLKVQDLKILCKSVEPLPEKYHGIENIELKYRFRHLDLIMDQKSKEIFRVRSKVIQEIRNFMNKKGFMEVETPVLQSMYGGAAAEPFETHFRRLDHQKMYLKISPEIYLKKLIVGGFEKVYEIGKNFRNEGIDRTHNPEFTMMEYYQAYTDYKDQRNLFKKLINEVVKNVRKNEKGDPLVFEYQGKKLNFKKWETLSIKQAVKKYSCLEHNKDQKNLEEALKLLPKKQSVTGKKYLDPDKINFQDFLNFIKTLEPKGDYKKFQEALAKADLPEEEDLKGELTVLAFEILAERHLWNPTFIIDFPLSVSPLTKQHRDSKYRLVERFEPYIAGMELGNAYTELNDPVDQKKRLLKQNRWGAAHSKKQEKKESPAIDENFIHALEVGMPPTGGVGLGVERLVMILTDQKSIRDCILFPALKRFKP